jgi:hypothetical protein
MPFMEALKDGLDRVLPQKTKSSAVPAVGIGNIGSGSGMVNYEDDVSPRSPLFIPYFVTSTLQLQFCCGHPSTTIYVINHFPVCLFMDQSGALVLLLFLPLLWVVWLAVILFFSLTVSYLGH